LNRGQILKLEEVSHSDPKILEHERSHSLKMWLRPLLVTTDSMFHYTQQLTLRLIDTSQLTLGLIDMWQLT